jgi:hypothetical protein
MQGMRLVWGIVANMTASIGERPRGVSTHETLSPEPEMRVNSPVNRLKRNSLVSRIGAR